MPGDPSVAGMRDRMSGAGGAGNCTKPYRVSSGALGRRDFVRPETIPVAVLSDAGRSCGWHEPDAGRFSLDLRQEEKKKKTKVKKETNETRNARDAEWKSGRRAEKWTLG
eukprot:5930373-Prymnesium_polylepis.1